MTDKTRTTRHQELKAFIIVGIFVLLELGNMFFMESALNLLITFPEVLLVLYWLIIKRDVKRALLFHVIFCLTGFDATAAESEMQLLSYPEAKLVGPLTLSYIILGLIWIYTLSIPISRQIKHTLIYKFRKVILIIMAYGVIAGIVGLMFFQYRVKDFVTPYIYIFIGFVFLDIIIKLYDKHFLEKCYSLSFYLIVASPIATFISFFILNIRTTYSAYDALISNEVFNFCPALLLFLLYKENCNKPLLFAGLAAYLACVLTAGRGAAFYDLAGCFAIIITLIYFKKGVVRPFYSKILKIGIPLAVIAILSYVQIMEVGENLASIKISELFSMFEAMGTLSSGIDISGISESPYVRIAEALNILDNGLHNIWGLLFGYGYGGYYTDSTHLFQAVPLTGAFPQEFLNSGRYGTAHSFLPTILLHNGVIGFIILSSLCIKYLKNIKYTPLTFAAFNLFWHSFYFNTSIIMAAAFVLFAAELKIQYSHPREVLPTS